MTTPTRIEDLISVETEHLIGVTKDAPLVTLRCIGDKTILLGQLTPAAARDIANHLNESAARAEYEFDLFTGSRARGIDDAHIAALLTIVREGEYTRHTDIDR